MPGNMKKKKTIQLPDQTEVFGHKSFNLVFKNSKI